jgi:hypothetical protein
MHIHNLLTCQNLGTSFMGGCGSGWLGLVILFFVSAVCRKWIGEEGQIEFSYILIITFTGSMRFALIGGLIGCGAGGFGGPKIGVY